MAEQIDVPICILAGGSARRFGAPKGLATIADQRLIDLVIQEVSLQSCGPVVLNTSSEGPYADLDIPLVPDRMNGSVGPLAGIHAAMHWAQSHGYDEIATSPIDVPFLPAELLVRLKSAGAPAICASPGRIHPIIGLWPGKLIDPLEAFLEGESRTALSWAEYCQTRMVEFQTNAHGLDPFFNINININTKTDLSEARERALGSCL